MIVCLFSWVLFRNRFSSIVLIEVSRMFDFISVDRLCGIYCLKLGVISGIMLILMDIVMIMVLC